MSADGAVDETDEHFIAGCHGTIAPQKDEAYYDDRSDASDDMEKGQLKFPKSIYGREKELDQLLRVYSNIIDSKSGPAEDNGSADSPSANIDAQDVAYGGARVIWLGGYSGIGKTALVNEFIRQAQRTCASSNEPASIVHASGKYSQRIESSAPFSAIADMLDTLASHLSKEGEKTSEKEAVWKNIDESDLIGPRKEGNNILRSTFPALSKLLDKDGNDSSSPVNTSLNAIKECTLEFFSCVCSAFSRPLIIFIDDLQWGDAASFDMLGFLLSNKGLTNVMFICSFRSNEVDDDHPFTKMMESVQKSREDDVKNSIESMDLFSLSPEAVTEFIADSVKKEDSGEVSELAEAIYIKTMGNIFFVMQALEELVRKNILFYDIMCFEWRWVVSKVELANYMSDDVVETIKGKIRELPCAIQHMLVVMAHIPNPVDVALLAQLMNYGGGYTHYDKAEVGGLLKQSSDEGMLLLSGSTNLYVFAHDRIRQALLEFGKERDEDQDMLAQHISQVLLNSAKGPGMDWCLFVAVDFANSLPSEKAMNSVNLSKLNLRVSKIASEMGSMEKANELLRKGLECLDTSKSLWEDYALTLELYNAIIESEFNLGSYGESRSSIDQVLKYAETLDDKILAHVHQLSCREKETSDHAQVAVDGCKILNLYGLGIPDTLTKVYIIKEEAKSKMALKYGSYSKLTKLKMNEDRGIFWIIYQVNRYAMFSGNTNLQKVLCWKAIQIAIKHGVDAHFPPILASLSMSMVSSGKLKSAQEVGNVALALRDEIRHDIDNRAMIQFIVSGHVSCLLQPFRSSLGPMLEAHKDFKLVGNTELRVASMMVHFYIYFAAGQELGPLIESRLVLSEGEARRVDRPSFLIQFQIARQFALNLRTRNDSPSELCGPAFCEGEELCAMNDKARKMALRDSSSYRLQLAFIFNNESAMTSLLEILKDYPLYDIVPPRLHNRLCFSGLAAFTLYNEGNESFMKLGLQCLRYFKKLKEQGSVNAKPVYLFMKALKRSNRQAFSSAIDACAEATFIHLEAMAREQFALFLYKENDTKAGNDYLTSAFWLYRDWRADFKALRMSEEYEFLKTSKRKNAKSISASSATGSVSTGKHFAYNSVFKSKRQVRRL